MTTLAEVGSALAHLENYRVKRVQEIVYTTQHSWSPIPASVVLALGFRESHLKNICGGATWDGTKWVQAYNDRGYLQITDTLNNNRKWLGAQEGCREDKWVPADPPVSALTPRHCPRFTPSTEYALAELKGNYSYAKKEGLREALRFAIAAYNAGIGGAIKGYREGNVDRYTAMGDYSANVLEIQPLVHEWIIGHPNWVWHPPT